MCRMVLGFTESPTKLLKSFFNTWEKSNPDGYGFYCITKKNGEIIQKSPNNDKFNPPKQTKMFLLHCRNKTSGWENNNGNGNENHPFASCDNKLLLTHNGYLYNYEDLRKELSKDHIFHSLVDSEILVHLLEYAMGKDSIFTRKNIGLWFDLLNEFDITGYLNILTLNRKTHEWFAFSEGSLSLMKPLKTDDLFIASDTTPLKDIFSLDMSIPSGYCMIGTKNMIKEIFYVGTLGGYSNASRRYQPKVYLPTNEEAINSMFGFNYERDW